LTEYFITEHPLNAHDILRFEVCRRQGKLIARISRWKGSQRTGECFEFASRHTQGVIAALGLVNQVSQRLAEIDGGNT
jgi:hypothetical protein